MLTVSRARRFGRATDPEDRAYFAGQIDGRRAALAVAADILADHPGCQKIADIAKRVIGQMPPF